MKVYSTINYFLKALVKSHWLWIKVDEIINSHMYMCEGTLGPGEAGSLHFIECFTPVSHLGGNPLNMLTRLQGHHNIVTYSIVVTNL